MKYRMKDLENFAATAGCSTMGASARKLGMSQPALSESIRRLEEDLNAALFYRSRSGIELTPRGRQFMAKVNGLLSAVQDLELDKKGANVFGGQSISIGCHPTVASFTLPKALARLQKIAPDFRVELRHDLSRNIQMEIQRGRIDVGVVINPVRVPELVISRLSVDRVAVWSKQGAQELDTLILSPHLFQSQFILKRWEDKPRRTIETDGLDLICRLTAQGLGYGIIPTKAVELSKEKLVQVSSLPTYDDEVTLVYRPEFGKTPAEKAIIESIRSAFW
jgi:DNA-binding transcriptional LysR family regulator